MITVIVMSHKVTEKGVEGSEKMMLYNMYYICWSSGEHMVI